MERNLIKNLKGLASELGGLEIELKARGELPEVSLQGLPRLNSLLWGIRKGMTVVAARTSQGKSAFALQLALDVASQDIGTLILSLEMDVQSMLERMFCNMASVDNCELTSGRFNVDESIKKKFEDFKTTITKWPLLLACGIGKTFQECNKLIEMLDPMPKVVILDYIQMSRTSANDRIEIGEYVRQFRQLMIEHNMRGIICSQINRQIERENDFRPRLENLKGTGALEEIADVCLLLHWNYFYTRKEEQKNVYDIAIAKNRNGRTGVHKLLFKPEYYRFEEIDYAQEEIPGNRREKE